jgi:hypothetical protein
MASKRIVPEQAAQVQDACRHVLTHQQSVAVPMSNRHKAPIIDRDEKAGRTVAWPRIPVSHRSLVGAVKHDSTPALARSALLRVLDCIHQALARALGGKPCFLGNPGLLPLFGGNHFRKFPLRLLSGSFRFGCNPGRFLFSLSGGFTCLPGLGNCLPFRTHPRHCGVILSRT